MNSKICPACGAGDRPFIGAFCVQCYTDKNKLFSFKPPALAFCVRCNRYRVGRDWKKLSPEELEELFEQKISSKHDVKRIKAKLGRNTVSLNILLDADGNEIALKEYFPIEIEKQLCKDCSLRSGGYHEAVIQLRGPANRIRNIEKTLIGMLERETFITKIEEKKEGPDIQVGNKQAALGCVSRLKIPYTSSNTLVGVRDGKKLLRLTILLRL